jgi:aryl-alcohol dehydrogenase-like predicted oxidoreductase
MQRRRLGTTGPEVGAIGLGCMGMSWAYGPADPGESVATIHAAMEAGINLLDTGDFYGMGDNEALIAQAIRGRRDAAVLSVKFGAMRDPGGPIIGFDARPVAVKNFLAYSLQRLGTDHVDIYRPARVDPAVPIEDTVGAIADLIRAGHVRHLGLSEAGAATIRRAHAVHPVADVQIEYSLMTRSLEAQILPVCRELGIGITAYGVLSRGLLSGRLTATSALAPDDFRAHVPRFTGENLEHNLRLVDALRALAIERNATPAQLALAWALHRGRDIVPLVGARTRERLAEALGALAITLEPGDLVRLEAAVPAAAVAGTRYDAHGMRMLDSEGRPGA